MHTHYKLTGTPNSPVLIFSNSLGSTSHMWDELVPLLEPYFRVLQYDTRGHGASDKPAGSYSIELLGKDVLDLMDKLAIDRAYFCGLSMGGLIGQWLAIHASDRFYKIVLSNTAAKIGTVAAWSDRVDLISKKGMSAIAESTLDKWFTEAFHKQDAEAIDKYREMFLSSHVDGYSSCCQAIGKADFTEKLNEITTPIMVITGDKDPVTNVAHAEFMVEKISQAEIKVLPGKHLVSAETPTQYAQALIDFFIGSSDYERGMHVRKSVLGEAHVSKSLENINQFNADFQDLVANVPWGKIWSRPGLSKHQRSLITLAMMIALNRPHEYKMHVKAAFNNGVTVEQLKELILQASIYCGFPASLDAHKMAEEVFTELNITR